MVFKVINEEEMDDAFMISPGKHGSHTPGQILSLLSLWQASSSFYFFFFLPHLKIMGGSSWSLARTMEVHSVAAAL